MPGRQIHTVGSQFGFFYKDVILQVQAECSIRYVD